jgi:uncharacterized protein (TIGR02117 family)
MFRKASLLLLRLAFYLFGFVALYLLAVFTLPYISVNDNGDVSTDDGVEIYILTNGVHTDLVLPMSNPFKTWSQFIDPSATKEGDGDVQYAAFGWGDKGFYLDTPTWADLKFSTAFKAMFFLSTSAMHVTYYKELKESESCKRIIISMAHYRKLVTYIENSFSKDSSGRPELLQNAAYGSNDSFYDARGTYNLFFTCNTWANEGLKSAGQKACLWTARQEGIFDLYRSMPAELPQSK